MGVQGLWELLAPVGRRVSVETLAGKKLAIDASIWMVQFMKAMRDDKGEMVHNAHLLGFFRRICKLLFLRTKPVFVFDGGTPALKRRTVAARRRHRDTARAKIRKTAEKLLLNHLKSRKLEELAEEIKNQRKADDDLKGKKGKGKQVVDETLADEARSSGPSNQESLDELLAKSLAAEEETGFGDKHAYAGDARGEEEDDDEDEEMIFPVTGDNIDPTVLASLPPSMQLDLLGQMRERLMAENRQKYKKIKKVPSKFSELQIQSYLKTVAFRREIDKVQKCAAGRGIGGVQTSRIASEANREFIFSSSFTGDKQMLTSTGVQVNGEPDHSLKRKSATAELLKNISSTSRSKSTSATDGKLVQGFGDDVETYCDERGRVRVSRVRGLGMRMTRDIQRNLDLLYEYEQEKKIPDSGTDPEPSCTKEVRNVSKSNSEVYQAGGASTSNDGTNHCDEQSMLGSEAAIEISFSEDDDGTKDIDDYFLHLVSGSSTLKLFSGTANSEKNGNDSDSECVWEEGSVEKKECWEDDNKKSCTALAGRSSFEEDEVDWEEGTLCLNSDEGTQLPKVTTHVQAEHENLLLNRQLDEEADIQEAIRRSLEDFKTPMSSSVSNFNANVSLGMSIEAQSDVGPFLHNSTPDNNSVAVCVPSKVSPEMDSSRRAATDGPGHADFMSGKYVPQNDNSPGKHLSSSTFSGADGKSYSVDELDERLLVSSAIDHRTVDMLNVNDLRGIQIEQCINASKPTGDEPHIRISTENLPESHSDISLKTASKMSDTVIPDANDFDAPKSNHSFQERQDITDSQNISLIGESRNNREPEQFIEGVNGVQMVEPDSFRGESTTLEYSKSSHSFPERQDSIDSQNISLIGGSLNNKEPGLFIERDNGVQSVEPDNFGGETMTQEYLHDHAEVTQENLEEEISLLRQERIDLGDEQRKHERNAESVSSEMFAECQELLQMFGLPYIIAPMEAEAQCAHMELSNLVDGVVTDDSDVFLFGARSVYKNIFDDRKYVETYLMKDIESELGLSRDKLIHMAMLLGSDYTEGVSGIGIVNAIEVVRAFPEEDGLQKFRDWVESPDPSILGKLDPQNASKLKRTPSKASKQGANGVQNNLGELLSEESTSKGNGDQPPDDTASDIKTIFMNTHRTVSKNWHLPSSFPSELVVSAYISPQVDESTVPFSWGRPDLVLLRKLCWERFGWSNQKADELLVPVLKEHNKHETQLRLEAFYSFNERFAKIRSKRINKAVKGITGTSKSELMHEHVHEESNSRGKKRSRPSASEECNPDGKSGKKSSKTPKMQNHTTDGVGDSLNLDHDGKNSDSATTANMRGSGRGRGRGRGGRGRGRGTGRGRGRGRGDVAHQSPQESTSDESNDADEIHESAMGPEATSDLRRSMRPRKHVKFLDENVEVSDPSDSSNQKEEGGMCNAAVDQDKIEEDDSLNRSGRQRPVDSVSEDCYFSGGGFCVDEDDTIQPVAASTSRELFDKGSDARFEDTSGLDEGLEDSSSRAYLFGGGGFCVDENDGAQPIASPVKDPIDKSTGAGESGVKRAIGEDAYGDEKEGKPGLTAMPWLRRKRRKA